MKSISVRLVAALVFLLFFFPSVLCLSAEYDRSSALTPSEIKRDGRFIAYSDGTVLDTATSLMWPAADNGRDIDWPDARKYCEFYRGGGYADWRLPTRRELATLYDGSRSQPGKCFNSKASRIHAATEWIDITCFWVWTSESEGAGAYVVSFHDREILRPDISMAYSQRVLPVRSAK